VEKPPFINGVIVRLATLVWAFDAAVWHVNLSPQIATYFVRDKSWSVRISIRFSQGLVEASNAKVSGVAMSVMSVVVMTVVSKTGASVSCVVIRHYSGSE
jgi:hypothetical protein